MQDYIIATDSASDLTPQQAEQLQVEIIPLSFVFEGKTYYNLQQTNNDFFSNLYEKMRQGEKISTSQATPSQFTKFFEVFLKQNKDILFISFTSALSGTYHSAVSAAYSLKKLYPDRNIEIIDSLCASLGEALLVINATIKKKEGASLVELKQYLESSKLKVNHIFTVDSLEYLKQSGRVSSVKAFFGGMLGIRPILHVNNFGQLINFENVRGRKQSLDKLLHYFEKKAINPENQKVFIVQADCKSDALYLQSKLKENFAVQDITINSLGPVIGAHSGPGTISLFFMAQDRNIY